MNAQWKRRAVAITIAVMVARTSRKLEPDYLAKLPTANPEWITSALALAFLILCFRMADRIPDSQWDALTWLPRLERPKQTLATAVGAIAVLLAFSGGAR